MRVTLKNGVVLEFDSTGMVEDFKECGRMAVSIYGTLHARHASMIVRS